MTHDPLIRYSKYPASSCHIIVSLLLLPKVSSVAFAPPPLPALEPTSSAGKSLARACQRRYCFHLYSCCGVRWRTVPQRRRCSWLFGDSITEGDVTPSILPKVQRNNKAATTGTASDSSPIDEVGDNDTAAAPSLPEDAGDADIALAGAAGIPCSELEAEVANFAFAPAMTLNKFKTLQDRRVPVDIKYSGGGGFKRYFEEVTTLLKKRFPDVLIQREIVEVRSTRGEQVFEIRIDGKLVCAKHRGKAGVFLQMETVEQAVKKARRRRRPGAVVYGDHETYRNIRSSRPEAIRGRDEEVR